MNKADLIDLLAPRLGGRAQAALAVESFVDVVLRAVADGGSVGITGFGTFESVERAARTGRNPRTGEAVPIAATRSPRFRPGTYFKDIVTDPAQLPADSLAGARVSSEAAAVTPASGAPASVRRAASGGTSRATAPKPAAEPAARSGKATPKTSGKSGAGAPASVKAKPAAVAAEPKASATAAKSPDRGLVTGGEDITAAMIDLKKAQLARAKSDELAPKKAKKDKDGKKDKKGKKK